MNHTEGFVFQTERRFVALKGLRARNSLITRHAKDYMLVMLALDYPDADIIHFG